MTKSILLLVIIKRNDKECENETVGLYIYVELKNPTEFTVALNKERVVIRGVDCRTLGALGLPLPRLRLGIHY